MDDCRFRLRFCACDSSVAGHPDYFGRNWGDVMLDKKKLIEGLEMAKDVIDIWIPMFEERSATAFIEEAIAVLKTQPQIVRCKDCRWSEYQTRYNATTGVRKKGLYCRKEHTFNDDDWYCPKGKPKGGEVE